MKKHTASVTNADPPLPHGFYDIYLASEVDEMRAKFDAAADLHALILADKHALIAELESQIATLERSNQRLRQKIDRLSH